MKGKKFSAAEKHFEKQKQKYLAKIEILGEQAEDARRETRALKSRKEELERENEELRDWVERLLTYTELSREDIKKVCEADKAAAESLEFFKNLTGMVLR